jgi:hypothetical protein
VDWVARIARTGVDTAAFDIVAQAVGRAGRSRDAVDVVGVRDGRHGGHVDSGLDGLDFGNTDVQGSY